MRTPAGRRLLLAALFLAALSGAVMTQSCSSDDECPKGEHLCGLQGCTVNGVCPAAATGTAPGGSSPDATTD